MGRPRANGWERMDAVDTAEEWEFKLIVNVDTFATLTPRKKLIATQRPHAFWTR
jgi:hypothetical protein